MKNVETSSGHDLHVSESKDNPCHSKENQLAENAPPALDRTGQYLFLDCIFVSSELHILVNVILVFDMCNIHSCHL